MQNEIVLSCINISKNYLSRSGFFNTEHEVLHVLNNISLNINCGETLGLVGASGCGKSTLARIITGLLPPTSGEIYINSQKMNTHADFAGKVQMVFQNPFSSLNPRLKIGKSIAEPLILKKKKEKQVFSKTEIKENVFSVLKKVGLSAEQADKYPHEFSGGQRQRIAIARAIITKPPLLVCDEAVSALDVSIQAQILNLLKDLKEEYNLSMLFISHDMNVVNVMSDNILEL